jgi:hypothetical protein
MTDKKTTRPLVKSRRHADQHIRSGSDHLVKAQLRMSEYTASLNSRVNELETQKTDIEKIIATSKNTSPTEQ